MSLNMPLSDRETAILALMTENLQLKSQIQELQIKINTILQQCECPEGITEHSHYYFDTERNR